MIIGADDREMIYGLVEQADVEAFRNQTGNDIRLHVWGTGDQVFKGKISRVLPRASNELKHDALGAHAGGPLAVRKRQTQQNQDAPQMELTEPRFQLLIEFAGCEEEHVRPGQAGYARLNYRNGTVGEVAIDWVQLWIRNKRREMSSVAKTAQAER